MSALSFGLVKQNISKAICRSLSTFGKQIKLVEVGPRDGLQNEKLLIPTHLKVTLVDRLSSCGLGHIEVSSFVNPKLVPQLADATEVFQKIQRSKNVKYSALIPNVTGMLTALNSQPDEVAVLIAASEGFSQRNLNCSIQKSLERLKEVIKVAKENQIPVRGYISCVLGCPYEGSVQPDVVARLAGQLWEGGCYEISLGDTIGCGTPERMHSLLSLMLSRVGACPVEAIAVHCHETGGKALANIDVALDEYGITVVDSSIGGLGGCPFAGPNAPGNIGTEVVVGHLLKKGRVFRSAISMECLLEVGAWFRQEMDKLSETQVRNDRSPN